MQKTEDVFFSFVFSEMTAPTERWIVSVISMRIKAKKSDTYQGHFYEFIIVIVMVTIQQHSIVSVNFQSAGILSIAIYWARVHFNLAIDFGRLVYIKHAKHLLALTYCIMPTRNCIHQWYEVNMSISWTYPSYEMGCDCKIVKSQYQKTVSYISTSMCATHLIISI